MTTAMAAMLGTLAPMRRFTVTLFTALATLALLAPVAMAHDGGEGLYGETDDKVVTNAGFILIIFFPLFVTLMTVIQSKLEKRKDARKAAASARKGYTQWRGGW
jgi:hypothetical protein